MSKFIFRPQYEGPIEGMLKQCFIGVAWTKIRKLSRTSWPSLAAAPDSQTRRGTEWKLNACMLVSFIPLYPSREDGFLGVNIHGNSHRKTFRRAWRWARALGIVKAEAQDVALRQLLQTAAICST